MRGKLPPGQTRRFGREQGLLDKPSDAQLLLEALALLQLSLTLANEVKRPQRWRGLASQVLQQTAILHAVGRLAAAWPQAKDTDHLALRDQWHCHVSASLSEVRDGLPCVVQSARSTIPRARCSEAMKGSSAAIAAAVSRARQRPSPAGDHSQAEVGWSVRAATARTC